VKKVIVLLLVAFSLKAAELDNLSILELFKKRYYTYICMHRWKYIEKYNQKREDLLSLVAYSCLKKHFLTPALDLSKVLRITKEGRINAIYINTLYLMKLLLISYFNNEDELLKVKLPTITNDLLAKVFYLIKNQKPKVFENTIVVKDNEFTYKITYKANVNNILIDVYKNEVLIKKEKYW